MTDLHVTPDQFRTLQDLAWSCSGVDFFDEARWEQGVREMFPGIPDGSFQIKVHWQTGNICVYWSPR